MEHYLAAAFAPDKIFFADRPRAPRSPPKENELPGRRARKQVNSVYAQEVVEHVRRIIFR